VYFPSPFGSPAAQPLATGLPGGRFAMVRINIENGFLLANDVISRRLDPLAR